MIIYVENPNEFTKNKQTNKNLDLISKFNKVVEYIISIHKSSVFLFTSNEYMDTEMYNYFLKKIHRCNSNLRCETCTGLVC